MIITAMHHPDLLAKRKDLGLDENEDVVALCRLGCKPRALQDVLLLAAHMPEFYPPISAPTLRKLARDLRDVLQRMTKTTPSLTLPFARDLADGSIAIEPVPTGGDLHVSPELTADLSRKADAYDGLARLCAKRMIPTRAQFKMLAYLWPVFYVEERTGRPHYEKVANLLGFVEIVKNEKQLMKGLVAAKSTLPPVVFWMKQSLPFIENVAFYL